MIIEFLTTQGYSSINQTFWKKMRNKYSLKFQGTYQMPLKWFLNGEAKNLFNFNLKILNICKLNFFKNMFFGFQLK